MTNYFVRSPQPLYMDHLISYKNDKGSGTKIKKTRNSIKYKATANY